MADRTGSKNKNKVFLLNRLKDMYGEQFDPVMRAAALAFQFDALLDDKPELIPIAIDKWLKVAEFTNGKVSAITISQDPDNPLFEMSSDERIREIKKLQRTINEGPSQAH